MMNAVALRRNLFMKRPNALSVLLGVAPKDLQHWERPLHGLMKPPNIVIFSERRDSIQKWKYLLDNVLSREMYVIYKLPKSEFVKSYWMSNVSLLVIDQFENFSIDDKEQFDNYMVAGGNAFLHCSINPLGTNSTGISLTAKINELAPVQCAFQSDRLMQVEALVDKAMSEINARSDGESICKAVTDDTSVVSFINLGEGRLVTSAIDFLATLLPLQSTSSNTEGIRENFQAIETLLISIMKMLGLSCVQETCKEEVNLTPGVVLGSKEIVSTFITSIKTKLSEVSKRKNMMDIQIIDETVKESVSIPTPNLFPLFGTNHSLKGSMACEKFDFEAFSTRLRSKKLGKLLIYTDVITSTQLVLERVASLLADPSGIMCVAGRQIHGKGRGGNSWLSPFGCMMFSLVVSVSSSSVIGQRLPYLQHVVAVAIVHSIREKEGYEDLDVRIKWPNDIYIGKSIKIGGLLVNSSYCNGEFQIIIGVGLNVSNSKPTICLNRIIEQYNLDHQTNLPFFTTENLLASVVSNIERFLQLFEDEGYENFCEYYYKYWLHSNQVIKMQHVDGDEVIVRGLDPNGFLLVETNNGDILSLQPDGNSFDMMQGLITIKTR